MGGGGQMNYADAGMDQMNNRQRMAAQLGPNQQQQPG